MCVIMVDVIGVGYRDRSRALLNGRGRSRTQVHGDRSSASLGLFAVRLGGRQMRPCLAGRSVIGPAPAAAAAGGGRLAACALSVTALEQVLGSSLEALGGEHFEAEGVGQPVGRVERGADRERVLDLLGRDARGQHLPHVLGAYL